MADEPLIGVRNLRKWYPLARGIFASLFGKEVPHVKAVDGVTFDILKGEIFVLAGESGCGKTTTGKTILRLVEPTDGGVYYRDINIFALKPDELRRYRRKMQIIFQDPYASLNPRMRIYDAVAEPLRLNKICEGREEESETVCKSLETVELVPVEEFLWRYPHELSGGQRQRVSIARAIALKPDFIVADEPVSMIDVSLRAEILDLLLGLRDRFGITYLYITHDLAVASYVGDRIGIMYLGKIVEIGSMRDVILSPEHPYTKALISAVPTSDPTKRKERILLKGEPPSAISPPPGCRFHPRCPFARDVCRRAEPEFCEVGKDHLIACHLVDS